MLGCSHMTNKYIDVFEQCDGDHIDNTANIAFQNKEKSTKHKINVIFKKCFIRTN